MELQGLSNPVILLENLENAVLNHVFPITPAVTITTVSDKTTVIEQPREESPFLLPIPPPQSMSLPFIFTSTATRYFPMIPSDEEFMPPRDDVSETELSETIYSRSQTPSP